MLMAPTSSAHEFVSQNPSNTIHGLEESAEQFEARIRQQYEKDGVVVNESCFPVLVFETDAGPFMWVDCERKEGFES